MVVQQIPVLGTHPDIVAASCTIPPARWPPCHFRETTPLGRLTEALTGRFTNHHAFLLA